jgi:deoxycytidine triphosphate deaminase
MGKLTGAEILSRMSDGRIIISDFDRKKLNPNSYNLRLAPTLSGIQTTSLVHSLEKAFGLERQESSGSSHYYP